MSWRREFAKLQRLFRRDKPLDDIEEEIYSHLKMEERDNLESGMSEEEAYHAAVRRFGNVTRTQERSRDMWAWNGVETVFQDIRYGLRQLRRNSGFTAVAVLTIALGIGATTAIFSVVNSVLLRPLPFKDPGRLVQLFETEVSPGNFPLSGADYLDWQAQNRTLEGTSLYSYPKSMSASGAGEPESAAVMNAQANFFDLLGVRPLYGRSFIPGEDVAGKNRVAVLSYGFWQRRFGGGADAIGKTVVLNDEAYTVVGVLPGWFHWLGGADLWVPADMSSKALGPHGNHGWLAIGRLSAGVTLATARAELLGISEQLEKQYPGSNNKVHAVLIPLKETLTGDSKVPLLILFGAVTLVLLIACVNVANLQLARASARHREMAVRASLGAGRLRLIRQMLTESVLLSLAGAAVGVTGAWWCLKLFGSAATIPIPRANSVQIDGMVLLFTVAASVLAGVLVGLAPALQTSQAGLQEELKAGSQSVLNAAQGRRMLRDGLVVAEISITVALLVGAGLLLRSFAHLRRADMGLNSQNVLTMLINLPDARYPTLAARSLFFEQLLDRVRRTPSVERAAVSSEIPLQGGSNGYVKVDGASDPALANQLVGWNYITPDYFRTLDIPVVRGRTFTPDDLDHTAASATRIVDLYKAEGAQMKIPPDLSFVAVISQNMARTFWQDRDPVGGAFRWNDLKVTVIGVVGDVKEYGIRAKGMPQAYFPLTFTLARSGFGHLTVRTRIPPAAVLGTIRNHVRALDGGLALFQPQTMEEVIAGDMRDVSVQTFLLGSFAAIALVLAAVGLYGVMSYLVAQRTREIGVRMALGARHSNVLLLIIGQGARLTLIGMLLGAIAALALTRSMSSLLYGVGPADPLTFVSVAALVAWVSFAAHFIPARRATKVDPIQALRCE
jgi:predicted permease